MPADRDPSPGRNVTPTGEPVSVTPGGIRPPAPADDPATLAATAREILIAFANEVMGRERVVFPYRRREEALAALDALVALTTRQAEALQEVEWMGSAWIGMETCPCCGSERTKGHDADCLVAAALRVAAENTQETDG